MDQRLIHLVASTPEKPWNWAALSANPCITQKDIEDYPFIPWNWTYVSDNPNITMDYVFSVPKERRTECSSAKERDWNYASLSLNPSLTIDHILDHPDYAWDWLKLSRHKNITWNHIQE